jgi:hypothetical protein
MRDEGQRDAAGVPDAADQKFWREFEQQLWVLVNKAEPPELGAARTLPAESPDVEADAPRFVSRRNLRKQDCLSFERYGEVAERPSTLTAAEELHLEDCRHCKQHVAAFAARLPRRATSEREAVTPGVVTKTDWRAWLVGWLRVPEPLADFGLRLSAMRASVALVAALILLAAGALYLLRPGSSGPDEAASKPSEEIPVQNQNAGSSASSTSPDADSSRESAKMPEAGGPDAPPPTVADTPNRRNVRRQASQRPPRAKDEQAGVITHALDFVGTPEEKRAVLDSERSGEISFAGSDFENLKRVVTRSSDGDKVAPVYPRNEATLEANPTFSWRGTAGLEYRIIVSYLDGAEARSSKVIAQSSGRLDEELPPGTYFWRIAARRKGSEDESVSGFTIFKILSRAERERLESSVNSTGSNMVRAILYARAGLLDKAEAELHAELRKNPRSRAAKKMLAQVRGLRR